MYKMEHDDPVSINVPTFDALPTCTSHIACSSVFNVISANGTLECVAETTGDAEEEREEGSGTQAAHTGTARNTDTGAVWGRQSAEATLDKPCTLDTQCDALDAMGTVQA